MIKNSRNLLIVFIFMIAFLSAFGLKPKLKTKDAVKEKANSVNVIAEEKLPVKNSIYYFNRGNNYLRDKKYKLALPEYDKSIELEPNNAEAYMNRGLTKHMLNDFWGAVQDYGRAEKLNPKLKDAFKDENFYPIKDK